jgi:DNA invertase Pin-like site-specific DNA recombinase
MKSIKRRFNNIAKRNPNYSSYLSFAEAVKGQGFSKQTIQRWFNKLVDKDDYARSEKRETVDFLINLSSPVRTTGNEGKSAP